MGQGIKRSTASGARRRVHRLVVNAALIGLAVICTSGAHAQGQMEPIPALLPDKTTIIPGNPMPIDGMWRIDALGARVRVEGGRVYALDSWVHLFAFKILPGQVVIKNLVRKGPGQYAGDDLPNLSKMDATLNDNQQLEMVIHGKLGPIPLTMTALMPDSPQALRREREEQITARPALQE